MDATVGRRAIHHPKVRSIPFAIAGIALATASPASAQACEGVVGPDNVHLNVEATQIRKNSGNVASAVYPDDRSRFLRGGGKHMRIRVAASAAATRACCWIAPGSYAMANYHDENRDRSFNRTLFAPKEGFGFSNDAPARIGLLSLAAARFNVPPGGLTLRMRMRYPG